MENPTSGNTANSDFPLLVSVDDHVMEAPRLWLDRAPSGLAGDVPHIVRERVPSVINPGTDSLDAPLGIRISNEKVLRLNAARLYNVERVLSAVA